MISGLLSTMAELLSNAAKYVENMNLLLFLNMLKNDFEKKKYLKVTWKIKFPKILYF